MSESDTYKSEVETLMAQEEQIQTNIVQKRVEGETLIRNQVAALLTAIRNDQNIQAVDLRLIKKRAKKRWVFEIHFDEFDLNNQKLFTDTVQTIKDVVAVAGLDPIVLEE